MALDELFDTFEFLKKRIEQHRDYLSQDETRTRQVLIDPLLKELGWDVGDPSAVELERRIDKGQSGGVLKKADYVLIHDSSEFAVVEAKRLGRPLDDQVTTQASTYANINNIPWVVVTDGDQWRMHQVFKPGSIEDRTVMQFQIAHDTASKCALGSLALWRQNICADGGPVPALEPVLVESPSTISTTVDTDPGRSDSPDTSTDFVDPRPQGVWYPLVGELPPGRPTSVRLGQATPSKWESWKRFYFHVAMHLVSSGSIRASDLPVSVTKGKNCVINGAPEHPDGRPFKAPVQLGSDMWLETDLNTKSIRELSRRLLRKFHSDAESVQVSYD